MSCLVLRRGTLPLISDGSGRKERSAIRASKSNQLQCKDTTKALQTQLDGKDLLERDRHRRSSMLMKGESWAPEWTEYDWSWGDQQTDFPVIEYLGTEEQIKELEGHVKEAQGV